MIFIFAKNVQLKLPVNVKEMVAFKLLYCNNKVNLWKIIIKIA